MLRKNKELRVMTFTALVLSVLGVIVAYISMSMTLSLKRTESVWEVSFTDLVEEKRGTVQTRMPNLSSTSINGLNVRMMNAGDGVTYRFKIKNTGAVDASLKVISDANLVCSVQAQSNKDELCENVSYNLTYLDGRKVSVGDVLTKGTYIEVLLTVSYTGTKVTDITLSDFDVMLIYEQV